MRNEHPIGPRIVVGVDGSESSKTAFRWAIQQAEHVNGIVDALIAWQPSPAYALEPPFAGADYEGKARQVLADTRTAIVGYEPPVPIRERAVRGDPATILVKAAADADLLVVGSTGRWGLARALLGSVSYQCAQNARCSVVIVRMPSR